MENNYIYVVEFNVPYDCWETVLVTTNVSIAINKIKNSHANCIKVWRDERMLKDFDFYKDEGVEDDCFKSDVKRFETWMKRVGVKYD